MQNNNPIEIEGSLYYTVTQFANVTNRSEQSVRLLMGKGNKIRKLQFVKFANKPFIPIDELTDFPFTVSGRNQTPYHYDKQGEVVNA